MAFFMILISSASYGAEIDLTGRDIYVRKGFDNTWLNLELSGEASEWLRVPGRRGNRPVRVRELGLSDVPRFHHFSFVKYPVMEFTYLTSFELTAGEFESGNLGLYLAQIGLNWQIYVNGNLIRDEMNPPSGAGIIRERAMRGVLMELDRRYLRAGLNTLVFRITGNPTDDRTGLFMKNDYLVGSYPNLQKSFRSEYPSFMLISVYFFFGIIYLLLYLLQRKVEYTLFYGLCTMSLAVFVFSRTKLVFDIIDDTLIIQNIQFISLYLGMSIFAVFIESLLRQKVSIFIKYYFVFCCLLCFTITFPIRETFLRIWQIITPLSLVYLLFFDVLILLVSELRNYYKDLSGPVILRIVRTAGATLIKTVPGNLLAGSTVLLACIIADIINLNEGISTFYSQYGFSFMTLGLAGILINQYVTTYKQLDIYSNSLKHEIEERKLSEENLLYARNYLRDVLDSLPSMLVSVNPEGRITQSNTESERLTGLLSSEMENRFFTEIPPFNNEDSARLNEIIFTGIPQELYRRYQFDGVDKSLRIAIFPLIIAEIRGAVIRVDDITGIEQKEEQLRQAQKMETIGNLASGLAHDFNNVLTGILGMASLLKHYLAEKDLNRDELSDGVETISISVLRAAGMVRQLLDLSRWQKLTLAPVDLNRSIRHVVNLCRNTLDKSVEIIESPYAGLPLIMADEIQVEQAILNLCINASHAMTIMRKEKDRHGGVLSISIEKADTSSHFLLQEQKGEYSGDYWLLKVSDTGIGMDAVTVSKIFDPFFTTKEKGTGTGLGLAMVNEIIHQHKGFIDVHSEKRMGSTFNIYFPVHHPDGDPGEHLDKSEQITKGSGTILVIDDEDVVLDVTRKMLDVCGYDAILAADGVGGLKIISERRNGIRAVILDMTLPDLSVRETYLEIKKLSPEVRVLITSGFKQDQYVNDMVEIGVNGFIQKPYSLNELSFKLREILEH
jgi:PAS domain S-box-containing protein